MTVSEVKVVIFYQHDSSVLSPIYIAVTEGERPTEDSWKPALRDVINGKKVVWARFPVQPRRGSVVWLRDKDYDYKKISPSNIG